MRRLAAFIAVAVLAACATAPKEDIQRHPAGRAKQDIYVVQYGESLADVAKKFGVSLDDLKKANNIESGTVSEGQRLAIPAARGGEELGGKSEPPAEKKEKEKEKDKEKEKGKEKEPERKKVRPQVSVKAPRIDVSLAWPVKGNVLSNFGIRGSGKHDGVDIGAPAGTDITAAADGTVIFSGWGPSGYGNIVVIRHTESVVTVYAHNKENVVERGTAVKRGMKIATVGSSGRATTAHCHFEVRVNRIPYDPLAYLGKQ